MTLIQRLVVMGIGVLAMYSSAIAQGGIGDASKEDPENEEDVRSDDPGATQIAALFKALDSDQDNVVSENEFFVEGPKAVYRKERSTGTDFTSYALFVLLDYDYSGDVSHEEFRRIRLALEFKETTKIQARAIAEKAFVLGDSDNDNKLTLEEKNSLQITHNEEEDKAEFAKDDTNSDGHLDLAETIEGLLRGANEGYAEAVAKVRTEFETDLDKTKSHKVNLKQWLGRYESEIQELGFLYELFMTALFVAQDTNDDDHIQFHEFLEVAKLSLIPGARLGTLTNSELDEVVQVVFDRFDSDKSGKLDLEELRKTVTKTTVMEAFDTNDDDLADKAEYGAFLKRAWKDYLDFVETPDIWALYRVEGRSWLLKSVVDGGGKVMTGFTRYTVSDVTEKGCIKTGVQYDKDMKPRAGVAPQVTRISFDSDEHKPVSSINGYTRTVETTWVKSGQYRCVKLTQETEDSVMSFWFDTKYPGLTVRGNLGVTLVELVEFIEFPKEQEEVKPSED